LGAKSVANEDAFLQQLCAEGEKLSVGQSKNVFMKINFIFIVYFCHN
jgi:hypothetical protein